MPPSAKQTERRTLRSDDRLGPPSGRWQTGEIGSQWRRANDGTRGATRRGGDCDVDSPIGGVLVDRRIRARRLSRAAAATASPAAGRAASAAASAPAGSAAAGGCTVGVSWNNYQEERWAKWDEPAIKAAVEAGGGELHRERRQVVRRDPGDQRREPDLAGRQGPDHPGAGRRGDQAVRRRAHRRGHPGHRL